MSQSESDQDLSDLLDDALLDFSKKSSDEVRKIDSKQKEDWPEDDVDIKGSRTEKDSPIGMATPPNSFTDASLFEKAMEDQLSDLLKSGNFGGLSQMPSFPMPPPPAGAGPQSTEDFEKMLSQMNLQPPKLEDLMLEKDEIMPMMEKMMKSLLSKDLLYPAIKDLSDKYPEWLAENRSKLTEPEYEKYNKQFDISLQITKAFEKDADTNDKEASDEVFAQIMHLMQSMQLLGNPPKELVGEAPLPTSPEECSIS